MTPNSAYKLIDIVAGTDYQPTRSTITFVGTPTDNTPTGIVTIPGLVGSPIYAIFCTTTNSGNTVIRSLGALDDGSEDITFPAGSFKQGVIYYIYLKQLVSDGGATFVGLKYTTMPVSL